MTNCHQPDKFGTATCSDILKGAAQLAIALAEKDSATLAEALFHKEQWEKDPLKAAGMVGFDIATLLLPFPKGTAALGKGLTTPRGKTGTTLADLAAATGKTLTDTTKTLTDHLANLAALGDTSLNALLKQAGAINTARLAATLDTRLPTAINALGADNLGKLTSLAGADQVTALLGKVSATTVAKTINEVGVDKLGAYLTQRGADNLADTITKHTPAQAANTIRDVLASAPRTRALVDNGKYDYLFGKVDSTPHNAARSKQNMEQLARVGVYDTPDGRALIKSHLDEVVTNDINLKRQYTEPYLCETRGC